MKIELTVAASAKAWARWFLKIGTGFTVGYLSFLCLEWAWGISPMIVAGYFVLAQTLDTRIKVTQ